MYLVRKHPKAFVLLTIIAERARRENGHPDGLTIGQCHLGDYKSYGLTEKEYRNAKKVLTERGHLKIIETCRTRKSEKFSKSTLNLENHEKRATERATRSTTIGTLAEICSTEVYDINSDDGKEDKGDRKGERGATEGRPKGDEQEGIRRNKKEEEKKDIAQPAKKQLRSKDSLSFDFEKWEFIGITDDERLNWALMYPHIDLYIETLKAIEWLKKNPSKQNKTLWRKFLTGWFQRANDYSENKKAYQSAKGSPQNTDRRTKDVEGKPVENQYAGKF